MQLQNSNPSDNRAWVEESSALHPPSRPVYDIQAYREPPSPDDSDECGDNSGCLDEELLNTNHRLQDHRESQETSDMYLIVEYSANNYNLADAQRGYKRDLNYDVISLTGRLKFFNL